MNIKLAKKEWRYILILFIVSFIIQIFVVLQGGETYHLFTPIIGIMMFFPTIGAIISLLISKEKLNYINWKLGNPIYLLLSLTLPALITILSVLSFEAAGIGTNKYFDLQGGEVTIMKELFVLGNKNQNILFFVLNFLLTGIVYSLVTGIMTLGEEIGWRGYLQKKLLENNSILKSLTFLGLIWGFWHLPLILSGYNYPEYPILGGFVLFPLTTIFASFLLGWLTINGHSVWPAVFAHGGVNSIMSVLDSMDFGENKLMANIVILGVWGIIAFVSYKLVRKEGRS